MVKLANGRRMTIYEREVELNKRRNAKLLADLGLTSMVDEVKKTGRGIRARITSFTEGSTSRRQLPVRAAKTKARCVLKETF